MPQGNTTGGRLVLCSNQHEWHMHVAATTNWSHDCIRRSTRTNPTLSSARKAASQSLHTLSSGTSSEQGRHICSVTTFRLIDWWHLLISTYLAAIESRLTYCTYIGYEWIYSCSRVLFVFLSVCCCTGCWLAVLERWLIASLNVCAWCTWVTASSCVVYGCYKHNF